MTCIVSIIKDGIVYMAGDSAVSIGDYVSHYALPKVWMRCATRDGSPEYVFGACGSLRADQVLRYLPLPARPDDWAGTDHQWLVGGLVETIRIAYEKNGLLETKDGVQSGNDFLVGYRGKVYEVSYDFCVLPITDNFTAIGSGASEARGVLYTRRFKPPMDTLYKALKASAYFKGSVRPPFHHEILYPVNQQPKESE